MPHRAARPVNGTIAWTPQRTLSKTTVGGKDSFSICPASLPWMARLPRLAGRHYPHPWGADPVLSRSQWAGSDAEVLGKITGPDELEIVDILYAPKDLKLAKGKRIIGGLDSAQKAPQKQCQAGKKLGWFRFERLPMGSWWHRSPRGRALGQALWGKTLAAFIYSPKN